MSVFCEKSNRVAVGNAISLVLMVILGVLIGLLSDNLALISMPIIIGIVNIFMIVEYIATPHHMMSIFEKRLVIRKSFGRVQEIELTDIEGIILTNYSRRSDAGILAIDVKDRRPIYVQAIKDAVHVKEYILNEARRYGYVGGLDIANIVNKPTHNEVNEDNTNDEG